MIRLYDGRTCTWVELWLERYVTPPMPYKNESVYYAKWNVIGVSSAIAFSQMHARLEDAEKDLLEIPKPLDRPCPACGAFWFYYKCFDRAGVCAACRSLCY
jgi:hypothetical protein